MSLVGSLYGVAADTRWTTPELAIDAAVLPRSLAVSGFLTPTPVLGDDGTVRVFGGMRDASGVSRIGWADIDIKSRELVNVCDHPALDVGAPGHFDSNGVILGDLVTDPATGDLVMAYVGFSTFPTVKFRAFSGLATSSDGGCTFRRVGLGPWLGDASWERPTSIMAVHCLRQSGDGGWSALIAVGDGWESIGARVYPRYFTVEATGPDLASLTVVPEPLLPVPDGVYRLGRPRFAPHGDGPPAIVATGGRRSGDYRPYAFIQSDGAWLPADEPLPIAPGCSPFAQVQAAYPAHVVIDSEVWVFFNGDDMGRAGALVTRAALA